MALKIKLFFLLSYLQPHIDVDVCSVVILWSTIKICIYFYISEFLRMKLEREGWMK